MVFVCSNRVLRKPTESSLYAFIHALHALYKRIHFVGSCVIAIFLF